MAAVKLGGSIGFAAGGRISIGSKPFSFGARGPEGSPVSTSFSRFASLGGTHKPEVGRNIFSQTKPFTSSQTIDVGGRHVPGAEKFAFERTAVVWQSPQGRLTNPNTFPTRLQTSRIQNEFGVKINLPKPPKPFDLRPLEAKAKEFRVQKRTKPLGVQISPPLRWNRIDTSGYSSNSFNRSARVPELSKHDRRIEIKHPTQTTQETILKPVWEQEQQSPIDIERQAQVRINQIRQELKKLQNPNYASVPKLTEKKTSLANVSNQRKENPTYFSLQRKESSAYPSSVSEKKNTVYTSSDHDKKISVHPAKGRVEKFPKTRGSVQIVFEKVKSQAQARFEPLKGIKRNEPLRKTHYIKVEQAVPQHPVRLSEIPQVVKPSKEQKPNIKSIARKIVVVDPKVGNYIKAAVIKVAQSVEKVAALGRAIGMPITEMGEIELLQKILVQHNIAQFVKIDKAIAGEEVQIQPQPNSQGAGVISESTSFSNSQEYQNERQRRVGLKASEVIFERDTKADNARKGEAKKAYDSAVKELSSTNKKITGADIAGRMPNPPDESEISEIKKSTIDYLNDLRYDGSYDELIEELAQRGEINSEEELREIIDDLIHKKPAVRMSKTRTTQEVSPEDVTRVFRRKAA